MTALRRITAHTYTLAFLGNALLLVLGWLWLYIPDAHIWQIIFTILFGVAILSAFLALNVTIIRRLYPAVQRALWQSSVILLGWLLLAHVLQYLTSLLNKNIETRAGYWNSQLSAHHRAFYTYERLIHWQNIALDVLLWIVIPALVLPFAVETIQRTLRPWRTALATLKKPLLWLTIAIVYLAGSWLGNHLIDWHPAYSVAGELISVTLRSALVYAITIALLLATLAIVAELLTREHARRNPTP